MNMDYDPYKADTKISSKTYKTLGNLLSIKSWSTIATVANTEKNPDIKKFLYRKAWEEHYKKKSNIKNNLTKLIKIYDNECCWYCITENIFKENIKDNYNDEEILNNECKSFIKNLYDVDEVLTGTYLEYVIRRIISERTKSEFKDSAVDDVICYPEELIMDWSKENYFDLNKLPISIKKSYKKIKDWNNETKNILLEIFIISLCNIIKYSNRININNVNKIIDLIQNTQDIIESFETPFNNLCENLLLNYKHTSSDENLDNPIVSLDSKRIGSRYDLIIDNTLYEIKCRNKNKATSNATLLQLLGYASLLKCNNNREINYISIIDLFNCKIIKYDISCITQDKMLAYLKLLTKDIKITNGGYSY